MIKHNILVTNVSMGEHLTRWRLQSVALVCLGSYKYHPRT